MAISNNFMYADRTASLDVSQPEMSQDRCLGFKQFDFGLKVLHLGVTLLVLAVSSRAW